jgi:hypothetical protein
VLSVSEGFCQTGVGQASQQESGAQKNDAARPESQGKSDDAILTRSMRDIAFMLN